MRVKVGKILEVVSKYFDEEPERILGYTRMMDYVIMRHIFFHLAYKFSNKSLFRIGQMALEHGRKEPFHHATVLHGIRHIKDVAETNEIVAHDIDMITSILRGSAIITEKEEIRTYDDLLGQMERVEKRLSELEKMKK